MARRFNRSFWVDTELWEAVNQTHKFSSARTWGGVEKLQRQLWQESPLVDGFVCWEWLRYMSPSGGTLLQPGKSDELARSTNSSLSFFRDYQRAILSHDAPLAQITGPQTPIDLAPATTTRPRILVAKPGQRAATSARSVPPGAAALTDGSVLRPRSTCWCIERGTNVANATLDLGRHGQLLPANFRAYLSAGRPKAVHVSASQETAPSSFLPIGSLVLLGTQLHDMEGWGDTQGWRQGASHNVSTWEFNLPALAATPARLVRFSFELDLQEPTPTCVAQLQVYE